MKKLSKLDKILFWLEKYLAAGFMLLLGSTLRYKIQAPDPKIGRKLYFFWHSNILALVYLHRFQNAGIMISNSKDGELIAGPVSAMGYRPARGSSNRGAANASKILIKIAKTHSIALTADGPKGPAYKIKKGMLQLAYLTGLPIVPIACEVSIAKVFNSWDRFKLPLPFAQVNVSYGKPFYIKEKDSIPEMMEIIQDEMDSLTTKNKKTR